MRTAEGVCVMANDEWILEVLSDMIKFSKENSSARITEALLDTEFVVHSEFRARVGDGHHLRLVETDSETARIGPSSASR